MVRLTNDEWKAALMGLAEPAKTATEYGHRGIITATAIKDEKTQIEADAWIAGAPAEEVKDTR